MTTPRWQRGQRSSTHVDVDDLNTIIAISEAVPGGNLRLRIPGRVRGSGAKGMSSDTGHMPIKRPVLPLRWITRLFKPGGLPFTLTRVADVDLSYRTGSGPGFAANCIDAGRDSRTRCGVSDAGSHAEQSHWL